MDWARIQVQNSLLLFSFMDDQILKTRMVKAPLLMHIPPRTQSQAKLNTDTTLWKALAIIVAELEDKSEVTGRYLHDVMSAGQAPQENDEWKMPDWIEVFQISRA
jgi:hypothetical protein